MSRLQNLASLDRLRGDIATVSRGDVAVTVPSLTPPPVPCYQLGRAATCCDVTICDAVTCQHTRAHTHILGHSLRVKVKVTLILNWKFSWLLLCKYLPLKFIVNSLLHENFSNSEINTSFEFLHWYHLTLCCYCVINSGCQKHRKRQLPYLYTQFVISDIEVMMRGADSHGADLTASSVPLRWGQMAQPFPLTHCRLCLMHTHTKQCAHAKLDAQIGKLCIKLTHTLWKSCRQNNASCFWEEYGLMK